MNLLLTRFLVNLKNTSLIKKELLSVNFNKNFLPVIEVLYKEGFILNYTIINKKLLIRFRYYYNINNLKNLKVISSVSKSVCLTYFSISKLYEKEKLLVFSTSKGILTSLECKKLKIGGVLLFIC